MKHIDNNTPIIPQLIHLICNCIPVLIPLALIAAVCILFLFNKEEYLIRILPFIILSLIASIILFYQKKKKLNLSIDNIDNEFSNGNTNQKRYAKIYWIVFILAITWLVYTRTQDIVFLVFIFLLFAISVIQIFAKGKIHTKYVLLQLLLTSLLLTGSQIFCHPYFYSIDDIFPHVRWATAIFESGFTLPESFGGQYTHYPLFHIGIAVTTMLSGIDISYSPYIVMLIPSLMATVFVYYIAKYFTKSERIAVAASFFYLMMPIVLKMAVSSMAYVMATLCFVIILYILTREAESKSPAWIILGVVVTAYMTAVHHASVVVIMAGMAVLIFSYIVYRKKATGSQVMTCGIFCAIPTLYFCKHYLGNIISIITSRIATAEDKTLLYLSPSSTLNTQIAEKVSSISPINPHPEISTTTISTVIETLDPITTFESTVTEANVVVYSAIDGMRALLDASVGNVSATISYIILGIFTLLLLIGIYHIVEKENLKKQYAVLLPFLIIFSPIFVEGMVDILGINIEAFRFRLMIAPIFTIIIALGCFILYQTLQSTVNNRKVSYGIIISIFIMLVLLSPCYIIPTDSNVYAETENREVNYFNENDLNLIEYVECYIPYGSNIISDHIMYRYYTVSNNDYGIPYYRIHNKLYELFSGGKIDKQLKYTILREELYESGNLEISLSPFGNPVACPDIIINGRINEYAYNKLKTYESGYNQIYYT